MFLPIKLKPQSIRPIRGSVYAADPVRVKHINRRTQVPEVMYDAFRTSGPIYRYSNGTRKARFVNVTVWKKTGEAVAFYEQDVFSNGVHYKEKYVWTFRHGSFHEVEQFNVAGGFQRELVGWA
jgi:hypothetical protein